MQLAIDTSTDTAGIALARDREVLAELTWHCGQNHTTQLLPQIAHLLNQTGIDLKSISGIIVARGPGSFNGLRVGISTAKGLAFSLGVPIIGISTLLSRCTGSCRATVCCCYWAAEDGRFKGVPAHLPQSHTSHACNQEINGPVLKNHGCNAQLPSRLCHCAICC